MLMYRLKILVLPQNEIENLSLSDMQDLVSFETDGVEMTATYISDYELLRLAAKASGIVNCNPCGDPITVSPGRFWNPEDDDGDALRLRNRIQAQLVDEGNCIFVGVYKYGINPIEIRVLYEGDEPDGYASNESVDKAVRHALVLAAAELGRNMK